MDMRAKRWMHSWLVGAAAAGMMGPGLLSGQNQPPASGRPAATPALLKPAPKAVRLVAHEPAADSVQLADSEVEQLLRELHERDGRQMPDMNFSAPHLVQQPAAPASRPRYSTAPAASPAPKSTNPVTSFFKKLLPSHSRSAPTQPAALPPRPPQAAQYQPAPQTQAAPEYQPAPQYQAAPQYQTAPQAAPAVPYPPAAQAQPAAPYRPVAQPTPAGSVPRPQFVSPQQAQQVLAPSQSAPVVRQPTSPRIQRVTTPSPVAQPQQVAPQQQFAPRPQFAAPQQFAPQPRLAPQQAQFPQSPAAAPAVEQVAAPRIRQPVLADDDDDEDLDADDDELLDEQPRTQPAFSQFDDDFPDPFAEAAAESTADESAASEPGMIEDEIARPVAADPNAELNEFEEMEEQNPYSGLTLGQPDSEPAEFHPPVIATEGPVDAPATDESTAAKMRRIIQRTDMKGLKGFCPVTLRDQRELADSRPEHFATYRGQKFYFATKEAQEKFEAEPSRYAPAAYGADVVVLTEDQDVAEGSLDHAAWFKGRLYLFSSQQTHDLFVANPQKYASPPGIE